MKRTSGTIDLTVLFTTVSVVGLYLSASRLGPMRSLRLVHAAWAMVPPPSPLGLALGAFSLILLVLTMWRIRPRGGALARPAAKR